MLIKPRRGFWPPNQKVDYKCYTNGLCTYNSNGKGNAKWLYEDVSSKWFGNNSQGFTCITECYNPGFRQCLTTPHPIINNTCNDQNGNIIYDANYVQQSLDFMAGFIGDQIDIGVSEGSHSFNDIHNGYKILRSAKWWIGPLGDLQKEFSITALDE